MRKALITITVLALIVSILGTGVMVYIDVSNPIVPPESSETK